ncbi:rhamnogalacturonan lyase6 [Hibiscus trionum]|uniref:rhamnogalacturonan endolyase n=1 Tax=Hibiscus trionum TaxID=183268 RepID=A0A9W7H147_HIBTR|nr:rhamnogalacturonan lyase6 [Hibiscus trionum]
MGKKISSSNSGSLVLWLVIMVEFSLLFSSVFCAEISTRQSVEGNTKGSQVLLHRNKDIVLIDNGLVEVSIEDPSGYLLGVKYKTMPNVLETQNINANKGYWDLVWDNDAIDKLVAERMEIITQTDELVEVSFKKTWKPTADYRSTVPLNIDKRYIVRRGVPGLYMYGIFDRQADFPDAHMDQIRIAFKLKEDKFHFMAVSDAKQGMMPTAEDREAGRCQVLAFKEAVLLTNPTDPRFKGQVDDKYQYSVENKDNNLHGWISDADAVGFWVITPSNEFRTGGPHKQELTSHVGPVSLSMFVSAHYAGNDMDSFYRKGNPWKKVFGPVFIYLNSASPDPNQGYRNTLWNDAKRQLREEIRSWPYNFVASEDFPHSEQRGEVNGQLLVRDRYMDKNLMPAKSAFVGLAAPGNAGSWQTEAKGYQFWIQTDDTGLFSIKNIRPGVYHLYAWVYGFIGDYKLDRTITIQPGNKVQLGKLIYDPPRNGPTLWEIGIPDRTAAEFFVPEPNPSFVNAMLKDNADRFRQYGLWDRYSEIYRHGDIVYNVGVSNYSKDWFFAHVPRKVGLNAHRNTTWQIRHNLQEVNEAATYTLQLALAAASHGEVQVRINDPTAIQPLFTTSRIGFDTAVARHGIHGLYRHYSINVPGNRFRRGENTIFLTQKRSRNSFQAVMYDYIRLEGPAV